MADNKERLNPNYLYLRDKLPEQRWVFLQGGTRSGKTYSVLHYLIALCLDYPNGKLEIDIVRNTFKLVKSTTWKDMQDILEDMNLYDLNHHNKTDHIYNLNGNTINYYGADDPDKAHGRKRDIIFLNECNQIDEDTIDQIEPRTTYRLIADYNPAIGDDHWLDRFLETYPPLKTTYRDNPYLTPDQVASIESRKDKPYWWTVYGTGERAKREGVIFPNWEYGEFDTSLPFYYGLDFGYKNDPDACVKVAIDEKREIIYVDELFYDYGNTINEIAKRVKELPKAPMVADSAEQRLINHLVTKSGQAIRPVKKGQGSVLQGIKLMENYKIVITKRISNLKVEMNNYSWSDKSATAPIDDYNHAIDAIRYVVFTYCNRAYPKQNVSNTLSARIARGESLGSEGIEW